MVGSGHKEPYSNVIMENNRHIPGKTPYNNQNAGELLILAFIGVGFVHNVLGDCRYIRQPVIA